MYVFERAPDRASAYTPSPKGRWWYEGGDEFRLVICNCPSCGKDSTMAVRVHSIGNDGTVSPSYVCPHAPCTFHEFVKLGSWTPPDARTE